MLKRGERGEWCIKIGRKSEMQSDERKVWMTEIMMRSIIPGTVALSTQSGNAQCWSCDKCLMLFHMHIMFGPLCLIHIKYIIKS